jgi:hypothetical protein
MPHRATPALGALEHPPLSFPLLSAYFRAPPNALAVSYSHAVLLDVRLTDKRQSSGLFSACHGILML